MRLEVARARSQDNADILALLAETPQPGAISLAFERAPDYFHGAAISCDNPEVFVLRQKGSGAAPILGVFDIGTRSLYVNGELQTVRYLHDLRLAQGVRGGQALNLAFQTTRALMGDDDLFQAVILDDNRLFLTAVTRPRKTTPDLTTRGRIETSLIYGRGSGRDTSSGIDIRQAVVKDLPAMQALIDQEGPRRQFFNRYDLSQIAAENPYYRGLTVSDFYLMVEGNELLGMVGTWDQKSFKQTRIAGYSKPVRITRPLYNAWAFATGGLPLPCAGHCFSYLTLHTIVIREHDPRLLRMLINKLLRGPGRRFDALACGFFTSDPLNQAVQSFSRKTLISHHFIGSWNRNQKPEIDPGLVPYADIARL